jgi:hypothetical protein
LVWEWTRTSDFRSEAWLYRAGLNVSFGWIVLKKAGC